MFQSPIEQQSKGSVDSEAILIKLLMNEFDLLVGS